MLYNTSHKALAMDVGTGGTEGAASPPTFGTGDQIIVLAVPKVGAFCTAITVKFD